MNVKGIYLAGGFNGREWQKEVRTAIQTFLAKKRYESLLTIAIFDPKAKELAKGEKTEEQKLAQRPRPYTEWDLYAIDKSDVVFVYIQKDNPGLGSLVELGYAKAKGKHVILVAERGKEMYKDRYLDFARETANVWFDTFEEGVEYLESLLFLLST